MKGHEERIFMSMTALSTDLPWLLKSVMANPGATGI